ncbi:MAG: hypothetical protein KF898_07990 [Parachlamydiales bacterium]|nr:hypothetical protein [Verrucomicrobiota bacterium]MBX3719572.1 hypothetical protein [Candidatus Acheromyda pituitae]
MSFRITEQYSNISTRNEMMQTTSTTAINGISNTPITITSMRESAHAESSSTLCQYFSNFIDWIKDAFLSLFGLKSVTSGSIASEGLTGSSALIESGERCIDRHFAQINQPFPFKAVVCIRVNDRITTLLFNDITTEPTAFKETAKTAFRSSLQDLNLQGTDTLRFKTFLLKGSTADRHQDPLSQGPFYLVQAYTDSCDRLGGIASTGYDSTLDQALNASEIQDYILGTSTIPDSSNLAQFLGT